MRLEIVALAELPPVAPLEIFEPVAKAARLFPAEGVDRKQKPVAVVARDLGVGKPLPMRFASIDPTACRS